MIIGLGIVISVHDDLSRSEAVSTTYILACPGTRFFPE